MKKVIIISILCLSGLFAFGQEDNRKLLQFSGLILTSDSNSPIPFSTIRVKNTYWGTISNIEGFFSLVVREKDTVEFSSLGFKRRRMIIPEGIEHGGLSVLIAMATDTLTFDETMIYPWPSRAKFKQAFLAAEPNKTYYDIAMENLNPEKMKALSAAMSMDGSESQHYYMNLMAVQAGYQGGQTNYAQFPGMKTPIPLSLLDPQAWYKFIKALKEGKFKRQEE